jgi:YegS/Rv2252/BmrU family lipid kinase
MKHIFILNPAAGKGMAEREVLPKILKAVKESNVSYEIHRTMNVGDAEHFSKNRCLEHPDEELRFYAVGGDGTLNEVVNGIAGFDHAELAFLPAGSGNDFARVFTNSHNFIDVAKQIRGSAKPIDLLRYNDRYCVNMINIGLDCEVVDEVVSLKKMTPLSGSMAYLAGIAVVFIGNRGFELSLTMEDGSTHTGEFTLVAIANGAFCGGGFKGATKALIDDGLLDVNIVRKLSRHAFLSLLPHYKKGTHLEQKMARKFISYHQCHSISIRPNGTEPMKICVDGEIEFAKEIAVTVVPNAIRFSVPEGSE